MKFNKKVTWYAPKTRSTIWPKCYLERGLTAGSFVYCSYHKKEPSVQYGMAFYWFSCVIKIAVIVCISFQQSYAIIQELSTQFTAGKRVATSHTTIASVSKIQCVEKCIRADRENNTCNAAGYNKNTRSCQLSLDQQQDVVNDTDPSVGVFFMNGPGTFMPCLFI